MTAEIQTAPTFNSVAIAERLWSHRQVCPNPAGPGWIVQLYPGDFVQTKVIDRATLCKLIALFADEVDIEEMYDAVIEVLNSMGTSSWLYCEYEIRQILEG